MFLDVREHLRTSWTKVFIGSRFFESPQGMRESTEDADGWEVGGMDGCGKGKGFIDGEVDGENGLLLIPDIYWVQSSCTFHWGEENPRNIFWAPDFRYGIDGLICATGINVRKRST